MDANRMCVCWLFFLIDKQNPKEVNVLFVWSLGKHKIRCSNTAKTFNISTDILGIIVENSKFY